MTKLVLMTALVFANTVGPRGNIIHTDPDGLDRKAREPEVSEEEADFLEGKRVAVRKGKKLPVEGEAEAPLTDVERKAEEDRQATLIGNADDADGKAATPKPAAKAAAGGKKAATPKPAPAAPATTEAAVVTGEGSKDTDPDVPAA